jgi:hypothetical protein
MGVQRPQNALFERVQKKLLKARMWEPVRDDLARQGFDTFFRKLEKLEGEQATKLQLSAAAEKQLTRFPGFANLPTRIRIGPSFRQFQEVPVPQFLDYEAKYQLRTQRDQWRAEELHRLAVQVTPYKATELNVGEAFERAQAQPKPADLVVMVPRSA